MDFDPSRLRRGEWIAGISALLLLVFLFALPWYGVSGGIGKTAAALGLSTSVNGWDGLTHLRWLVMVTILSALALAYNQATRKAPAIPAALSVIVTVLATLSTLLLIYRVLINVPGSDSVMQQKAGAYLGLLSAVVLTYGAYESMRREGINPRDEPSEIETIDLGGARGS